MWFFLVLLLLAVCCFAPGFFFVRRLHWSPLEKLCGAIGLSLILLYLAAWGLYCARAPGGAIPYWAVSAVCAAMGAASWRDIRRLFGNGSVRKAMLGQLLLWGWAFLILATIRLYSGAGWFGDDLEHFQRSLYFLYRFPVHASIWGEYLLPARPPMMNVLAAFFMAQTREAYDVLQVVFTFLNTLLLLPCCLILPALLGRESRRRPARYAPLALAALLALSPAVMHNGTYAWTKSLTAFFVILGIAFYLSGWRKADPRRTTAGFLALAAAMLVHYSAGPYCAFMGGHYLVRLVRDRLRNWREFAAVAICCGLLLATWFGWAVVNFGTRGAFQSNTSVTFAQRYEGNNLVKIGANLYDSLVPSIVRDPALFRQFEQVSPTGTVRDKAFLFYQLNIIFGMGLVGGPLAIWALYRAFRRGKGASRERYFWLFLIPCCTVVGIAVVGERDLYGVAHLTLLSMIALGLTLVASSFPLRRPAAIALLAGLAVDFSLGIYMQERIQNRENSADRTAYTAGYNIDSAIAVPGDPTPDALSISVQRAWYYKHQYELTAKWLGELKAYKAPSAAAAEYSGRGIAQLQGKMREDNKYWGGWFARHNNQMRYFGDVIAEDMGIGGNVLLTFMVMGFAGTLFWLGRQLLHGERAGRHLRAAAGLPPGAPRRSAAAARKGRLTMAPIASRSSDRPDPKPRPRA